AHRRQCQIPVVVTAKQLTADNRARLDSRIQKFIQKGAHLDNVLQTLNRMLAIGERARGG
ncbi:MAG: hypothetical protein VX930_13400, partial [Pseudomonadota bacterium]|nr:hypothetical protein [Pseudomonadota bacterium]